MRFRFQPRRAFTLIEVMIVIGIIMMTMTAGIPLAMKAMSKNQLAKAVNDVLEGCKLARDRAILQNRPFDFVIRNKSETEADMTVEAAKTRIAIAGAVGGAPGGAAPQAVSLMGDFPRPLGQDVAVELIYVNLIDHMGAAEARVRFYPNGTSDEFAVTFAYNGKQRTIKVDIITGAAYEVTEQ